MRLKKISFDFLTKIHLNDLHIKEGKRGTIERDFKPFIKGGESCEEVPLFPDLF